MITLSYPRWWMGWGIASNACVAAWRAKGASTLAASYVNLAKPGTYDAAAVNTVSLGADGWVFASNAYLTTGITPPSTASHSVVVRFSDIPAGTDRCVFGAARTTSPYNGLYLKPIAASSYSAWANDGTWSQNDTLAQGVMGVAGRQGYLDGAPIGDAFTDSAQGMPSTGLVIGALGGLGQFCYGKIQAVALYNAVLSSSQMAAVSAAMARL